MNIAIFASAFHPSLGGVEEICRQLAHEFRSRGHHVVILTNRWPRALATFEEFEGIPLYRLPFRAPGDCLKSKVSYALTHRLIQRRVARVLRHHAIEVLHVICVSSNADYALAAQHSLGLPLVVTLQGELTMDATQLFQRSARARRTLGRAMSRAEVVTGCSRKTLRDAEEFLGLEVGDRGRRVFNAARVEDFADAKPYMHPRPYLFALGRMVPQKGFHILLEALKRSNLPQDLLIAGEGEELPKLQRQAADLGLAERVHFVGRADRAAVAGYFKGCDFFVLPSTADEGLPVVCVEAMAAGKAVVATDSGGTAEAILDGENGIIIPKGDTEALVAALNRMSADHSFRQRAEKISLERVDAFRWRASAADYEAAYRDAMATAAARSAVPAAGALAEAK